MIIIIGIVTLWRCDIIIIIGIVTLWRCDIIIIIVVTLYIGGGADLLEVDVPLGLHLLEA